MKTSIIIPTYNEASVLEQTLSEIQTYEPFEVIVCDGGSEDHTVEIIERFPVTLVEGPRGRAVQMNAGAAQAQGDVLLFLHADSRLSLPGFRKMTRVMQDTSLAGGAFSLCIDSDRTLLRMISSLANLRSRLLHLVYGDQAIFVRNEIFKEMEGFAPLPICEDLEFYRRLHKHGHTRLLKEKARTSARRWLAEGIVFTTLRNSFIASAFLLGWSPKKLSRLYPPKR